MLTTMLGSLAGILCTISFVPQVLRIARTRRADDLSLPTYVIFSFGIVLWLVYGLLLEEWPIIIANSVTLVLALAIVFMKIRFSR